MTSINDRGWTLHYTIGSVLASPVKPGDVVHMPAGGGDLVISGGRAPLRANDAGAIFVRDAVEDQPEGREARRAGDGLDQRRRRLVRAARLQGDGSWLSAHRGPPGTQITVRIVL